MQELADRRAHPALAPDESDVVLRDGSTMRFRPPVRADGDALLAFFRDLSDRSFYLRLHGHPAVDEALVDPVLEPDWLERGALIGTMEGRIVAVANYIPYLGPIVCALLLFVGGLMTFPDIWGALAPPAIFISFHLVEANFFTPMVVGHRLTISPLSILVSLSFWAWVWGTTGALLAVPLLIILKTIFSAAGTPDIAGFLFEHGTLTHAGEADEEEVEERQETEPAMVDTSKPRP